MLDILVVVMEDQEERARGGDRSKEGVDSSFELLFGNYLRRTEVVVLLPASVYTFMHHLSYDVDSPFGVPAHNGWCSTCAP